MQVQCQCSKRYYSRASNGPRCHPHNQGKAFSCSKSESSGCPASSTETPTREKGWSTDCGTSIAHFVNAQVSQTQNHWRLNMKAYYLAVEEKSIRKSIYPISGAVTIGRGMDNTVVVSDPTVSRSHAKIEYTEGIWFLEDTGSANGIFVDDNRVKGAVLEPGKTYRIGKAALTFIQRDTFTRNEHFLKTAEILSTSFDDLTLLAEKERAKPWSKRLLRGIEMVPFLLPSPRQSC